MLKIGLMFGPCFDCHAKECTNQERLWLILMSVAPNDKDGNFTVG